MTDRITHQETKPHPSDERAPIVIIFVAVGVSIVTAVALGSCLALVDKRLAVIPIVFLIVLPGWLYFRRKGGDVRK